MTNLIRKIKSVPWWGWASGILLFVVQYGLYRLANWISVIIGTVNNAFEWKIAFIDDLIPVIPIFALPYVYSYVFWIMGPIAASLTKKRNFVNYVYGLLLTYIIGTVIFIVMPTYMDRVKEGLMVYADKPGFLNGLLAAIYAADGAERAFNLFPSFHCIISVYCYLAVRKQPEISKGFQMYSLIMAALIVLSTLFTKQHYIIDSIAGIAMSIGCWMLMNRLDPGKKYE